MDAAKIDASRPVVIFGAATVGEALFHALHQSGVTVACFTDNNSGLFGQSKCGIEVVRPADLRGRHPDAQVLIAVADIKDVLEQCRDLGFKDARSGGEFLRDIDLASLPVKQAPEFVEFVVATLLNCHDAYERPERIYLRSVDIVITERCSLKCADCSNLMQYYERPENRDLDEVTRSIDAFCEVVDGVNEFRVIGGEPFMNKDIHVTLERLNNEPKAKRVVVYTNATILPRPHQLAAMKNDKVMMLITDYGALSRNTDAFREMMDRENIAYFSRPAENWTSCSNIGHHKRSDAANAAIFRECCAKNLYTLLAGKLYRCPFGAHVDNLHAVPDYPGDYVDLLAPASLADRRRAMQKLIHETSFLRACDHCDGRFLSAPQIVPAIQVRKPLPYKILR